MSDRLDAAESWKLGTPSSLLLGGQRGESGRRLGQEAPVWWGVRPPGWIKPAWLRAEEQAIREGMPLPDRRERPFTPQAYALNWLGLLVGSAAWLAFGLPVGALLIGLSTGIALLLANRPTRA